MHRYTLSYFADSIVVLLLFAYLLYSHEYDKCGRVVKTRVSGGKIRQDGKSVRAEVQVSRCNKVKLIRCARLSSDAISSLMK